MEKSFLTKHSRFGFTLAEVLITLGIIGVVAAMTLPALVQNHRRQVVETSLAKFYSSINQAIKLSEVVNGDKKYWDALDWRADEDGKSSGFNQNNESISYLWYKKYLAPYLKTTNVEIANSYDGITKLYFADGSMLAFWAAAWYFFPNAKDYAEALTENGSSIFDKSKSGRKFFVFLFSKEKGVVPWGYQLTDEELKTGTYNRCVLNYTNEPATCATVIQRNGWKIPKDYPFKL